MVPRVFARSSTIFRYSQREFRSCLYTSHPTYCTMYPSVYTFFLSRGSAKDRIENRFVNLLDEIIPQLYEIIYKYLRCHFPRAGIHEGTVSRRVNLISFTVILTKVTRNSQLSFLFLLAIFVSDFPSPPPPFLRNGLLPWETRSIATWK